MSSATIAAAQTGWSGTVTTLSTDEPADDARMVVAQNGDVMAVWDSVDPPFRVRASRRSAATGRWSPSVLVATLVADPIDFHLAHDGMGNVMAVWREGGGQAGQAQYTRYTAATDSWSAVANLPGATAALYPEVAMDAAGNVTAIWHEIISFNYFLKSARFTAATGTWSAKRDIAGTGNGAYGSEDSMAVDADGNVTLAWTTISTNPDTFTMQAARYTAVTDSWSSPVNFASGPTLGDDPRLRIDGAGNVIAAWTHSNGTTSSIQTARYNRALNTWSAPSAVPGSANANSDHLAVDASGNIALMWAVEFGSDDVVQVTRYDAASGTWSAPATMSDSTDDGDPGEIAIDPTGHMIAVWNWFNGTEEVAQAARFNPATGTWGARTNLGLMGDDGEDVQVVVDPRGNIVVIWEREHGDEELIQGTEWTATLSAPVISSVTPGDRTLTVAFTPPGSTELGFAPINYEYSIDNGSSWIVRSPTSTGSPITIGALVNGTTYTIRVRAINSAGPGTASAPASGTPVGNPQLLAPTNLAATVTGNTVTLSWTLAAGSAAPAGYVVEGGLTPGDVLASLPTSSTATTFTFTAPTGAFYVRVHAVSGSTRSAASNEIQIFVNVPRLPNAPENLTGTAVGSTLNLQWRNNRDAGLADAIVLNVTGSLTTSVSLLGTASSFSFAGVPNGTYTFSVRATNAAGSSAPSNTVTLTFPGGCTSPGAPTGLTSSVANRVVTLNWTAPAGGGAPTSYVIEAGSAAGQSNLATVNIGSTATSFSTTAPGGTYFVRVRAVNACGNGAPTADVTIVVP